MMASILEVANQLSREQLLPALNKKLSNGIQLRFGAKGSLSVDVEKDSWYSHEDNIGGRPWGLVLFAHHGNREDGKIWYDDRFPLTDRSAYEKTKLSYDYRNAAGEIVFQVVRGDNKRFFQRRPDGNGGWINNLQGIQRVPYRLPDIAASKGRVYVVEGEKDVERLRLLGKLIATTNPGGAGKWRGEYSEYLKGREIVVIADNDDVGREHAKAVKDSLESAGCRVVVLALGGLPDKGDVSDWLAVHSIADLERFADAAIADLLPDNVLERAVVPVFDMPLLDLSGALNPQEFVIDNYLERGTNTLIWGKYNTFKTFLLIDMLLSVLTGRRWAQNDVQQGWVALICGEGYRGIARRVMAWAIKNRVPVADCLFPISTMPARINDPDSIEQVYAKLSAWTKVKGCPPALVGIDTVSQNFGAGDENSNTDMARFVANVNTYITRPIDTTTVLIHHPGKDEERGPRGGGSLTANTDADFKIERPSDENPAVVLKPRRIKDAQLPDEINFTARIVDLVDDGSITSMVLNHLPETGSTEALVIAKLKTGMSIRAVADEVGTAKSNVHRWGKKWGVIQPAENRPI